MIICLQTRFGELHYINWTTHRGTHYTMCGKAFTAMDKIETYGIDQSIPEACPRCRSAVEVDLQYSIRTVRGNLVGKRVDRYNWIQIDYMTPEDRYRDLLDARYWPKKNRMQRKKLYR